MAQDKTEIRREREMRTISQMIAMYCQGNNHEARNCLGHCGEKMCIACAELDAYAVERTRACRNMHVKTSCEQCGNHCYSSTQRERICAIMRYSGPRMITKHPVAAVRHLLGK